MTTIALPQIKGHDLLTHSRMQTKKSCARKHHYRYNLGVRKRESAKPLRMGAAIHLGRELLAKGLAFEDACVQAVADYETVPAWATTDERLHEWMIEREIVCCLLAGWYWHWREVESDILQNIATEFSFEHPIRNPDTGAASRTYRKAGKIDGIVQLVDQRLAVYELKTTGDDIGPDSVYWKRLEIDHQISLYMLAARESGFEVETVIYDVIRKPGIAPKQVPILDDDGCKIVLDEQGERVLNQNGKPRQSADKEKGWTLLTRVETPEEFGERLRLDIAERPEFYYQRREIPRLQADLDEFAAELWQQAADIRESINTGRHFRNPSQCTLMGKCEYLDLCARGLEPGEVPDGFARVDDLHPELTAGDD